LAWLELRQQLRSHVFWIVFTVSMLMVLGAAAIDALRLDAAASLGSGAGLIIRVHLIWTLFYLFTAAAFVADAVIRDDQTRFAPLGAGDPGAAAHLHLRPPGRAFAALCLCFLSVPIALLAARLLPGRIPPGPRRSSPAHICSRSACSLCRTCSSLRPCSSPSPPPPARWRAASSAPWRC
jgi:hypothetical protein